jgi:hypothetical protein
MPRSAGGGSLYQAMRGWVDEHLATRGYTKPCCKRLALLVTGLTVGEPATVSGLSQTLHGQAISAAQEPSIARRVLRLLDEAAFDPARLLPEVFRSLLPQVLAGVLAAHAVSQRTQSPAPHARFPRLRIVVDESSDQDAVHLLVVGLWYQGLVLPLAVRVWPQNTPLAEGDYWSALGSLLWEVHAVLPPALRDHVLLLADRGYGHPRVVDLATALGWAWVLRSTGQVRVQFPDGTQTPLRELAPRPGTVWGRGQTLPLDALSPDAQAPLAVFKQAGWRRAQVVAVWLADQPEPWLLLTNQPTDPARLAEYAQRWAIERLFLSWKSHGWNLEAGRVRDAARVGRLISGLVLATWWRIAHALPAAARQLAHLATSTRAYQLPLPLVPPTGDPRPWPAKFSLFTWGRKVIAETACRWVAPPAEWTFPDWDSLTWPQRCQLAAHPAP